MALLGTAAAFDLYIAVEREARIGAPRLAFLRAGEGEEKEGSSSKRGSKGASDEARVIRSRILRRGRRLEHFQTCTATTPHLAVLGENEGLACW